MGWCRSILLKGSGESCIDVEGRPRGAKKSKKAVTNPYTVWKDGATMFDSDLSWGEEGWTLGDFCILPYFKVTFVLQRACICESVY